ncbi:MAG: aminopeptidase P family protein [Thermomicrobium sp.]|nr:aminopeptidase P family protein [Thermomicrobium sp.]MDW8060381.1 aminopeptidase P family protein [Thermomicrobium sp.]
MNTAARLERLRQRLREQELDAIVITHPSNRLWLSGFTGEDIPPNESAGHLVIGHDAAVLVTSRLNSVLAQREALGFRVFDRERDFARGDATVLEELGARRVGFEDRAILYRDLRVLQEALGDHVELVPVGSLVDDLRTIKDAEELALIARAQEVTDAAFQAMVRDVRPGMTEREIALRLEQALVEAGADGVAFPIAVASGPHGALPHYRPTQRTISVGEPIVIDMGAVVGGYCADLTRTVWIGEADERLEGVFAVVLAALEAAEAGIRPGMTGREADKLARDVIERAGYGEAFTHSLGHGVGVRVHEAPALSPASEHVLEPGQVVTIEPGIYLPDWGGVRIEDLVVIREHGVEVLTRTPKRLVLA